MTIRLGSARTALIRFATRLGRDRRGNTLLLMAAGILPVIAAIGAGVDMTRGYMAQARLQEAVDSAALAGRKAMDGTDVNTAQPVVDKFLKFNYPNGIFNSGAVTSSLKVTSDGALVVDASTKVPTVMMGAFGIATMPVAAESSAKRSGSNIDVVLVLDVTGSMANGVNNKTATGSNPSKMSALQTATLNFLDALDSTRTQLASSGLRVRVGIIPYSQTVNIGRYLKDENSGYITYGAQPAVSQLTTPTKVSNAWQNKLATTSTADYYGWACYGLPNNGTTCKTGLNLTSFVNAGGSGGSAYTNAYAWKGCVEMRDTTTGITSTSDEATIPDGAWDIMDVAPGTVVNGKTAPAWRPYFALPQWDYNGYGPPANSQISNQAYTTVEPWKSMTFKVQNVSGTSYAFEASATNPTSSSTGAESGPNNYCPAEVKLLSNESLETKSQLTSYVNALKAVGSTLHDVGMFWGLAMISPGAPFTNADVYNGREVKRYIVFMTDGDMDPNEPSYSAYGIDDHEVRTKTGTGDTTALHNKRFLMLCRAAKAQGINISTVAFGTAVTTQLQTCATTTDQAYIASSASDLNDIFKQIAQNIGYLRISQ